MKDYTNFQEIYNDIEEIEINEEVYHKIAYIFQTFRDKMGELKSDDNVRIAQWEMDFFNFIATNGILRPMFTGTDNKGELVEHPAFSRFDDSTYSYLQERLKTVNNPLVKARYSHILWESPRKNNKYVKDAIDSYTAICKTYEKKDIGEPQSHNGLYLLYTIKNIYFLSKSSKYKFQDIKKEALRLINDFNPLSSCKSAVKLGLIELLLTEKRQFHSTNLAGIPIICDKEASLQIAINDYHSAINFLENGEKISIKTGFTGINWREKIAYCYEKLMDEAIKRNNLASHSFCQWAIVNYKKARNTTKVKELEKKYDTIRKTMKLTEFGTEIDLTDIYKECRKYAEEIVKKDSREIIGILACDKSLIPSLNDLRKSVKIQAQSTPFFHMVPIQPIDERGHTIQHFIEDDEKEFFHILTNYSLDLNLKSLLINEIIFKCFNACKLTGDIVIKLFKENSWFGKDILEQFPNGKQIKKNWLSLISPSIYEYFNQLNYVVKTKSIPNLILPMDSLVLKIEGLIRDICQSKGVTTFYTKKDKKDRDITVEKDLNALLHEEAIKDLFDEDDLLFFKFMLIEKVGYNLRNEIAHGLLRYENYKLEYMHFLFVLLIRLGKYDFV